MWSPGVLPATDRTHRATPSSGHLSPFPGMMGMSEITDSLWTGTGPNTLSHTQGALGGLVGTPAQCDLMPIFGNKHPVAEPHQLLGGCRLLPSCSQHSSRHTGEEHPVSQSPRAGLQGLEPAVREGTGSALVVEQRGKRMTVGVGGTAAFSALTWPMVSRAQSSPSSPLFISCSHWKSVSSRKTRTQPRPHIQPGLEAAPVTRNISKTQN